MSGDKYDRRAADSLLGEEIAAWFKPLSEEEVARRRALEMRARDADLQLRLWAADQRGILGLLVSALASRDPDETIGHIKVYDDGGKCLGYLADVVASLEKARRTFGPALDPTSAKEKAE